MGVSRPALPRIAVWSRELGQATMPSDVHTAFVRRVEALGYRMLWISESFGREVLSHAGLVLGRSQSLMVGTGIANIWARDAMAMHNGAQTLGEAYPGRFVLGVGVSHDRLVESRAHHYRSPLAQLEAYLRQMDEVAWTGPPAPAEVPILVGALGPRALELAGARTDGAHPYLVPPEHTAKARQILGPKALLAPEQGVVLERDPARARAAARAHLAFYLELPNYRRSFLRLGFTEHDLVDGGSDQLVDRIVAWGDVDDVVARVEEHLAAGADQVALQALPAHDGDDPLRALEALADPLVAT